MFRASLSFGASASLMLFAGCATLLGLTEERELAPAGGSSEGGGGGTAPGTGGAGGAADRYADFVVAHGGVAYFRFEDDEGAVAFANAIDSNRAAQKEDGVTQAAGALGLAAKLAGAGNAHVADVFDFAGMAPMSIELWLETPGPASGLQQVLAKRFVNAEGYSVNIDSQHRVTFTRIRNSMSTNVHYLLDEDLDYGRFIHVVATFSEAAGSRLFIDGEQRGEAPSADEVALLGNDEQLEIGGDAGLEFTGLVDEVALYDRELTLDEIQEHFAMVQP